uniref:Putative secreted protein n=1 Tax=Anopheles darlingi TaxID=43151 RepID=A0A2M4DFY3_ANODA
MLNWNFIVGTVRMCGKKYFICKLPVLVLLVRPVLREWCVMSAVTEPNKSPMHHCRIIVRDARKASRKRERDDRWENDGKR